MSKYQAALPAQTAAGADSTTAIGAVETTDDNGVSVSRVLLIPPAGFATVTGVVTNNVTFSFRQLRAAVSLGTFATVTLGSGANLVAETPLVVPITGPAVLAQDDVIDVVMHQNGLGLAVGAGVLAVTEVI